MNYPTKKFQYRVTVKPENLKEVEDIGIFKASDIWFPHLSQQIGEAFISGKSGWINILTENFSIIEFNENEIEEVDIKFSEDIDRPGNWRYTFGKVKDCLGIEGYKFLGKYLKTKNIGYSHNGKIIKAVLYERVDTTIPLL